MTCWKVKFADSFWKIYSCGSTSQNYSLTMAIVHPTERNHFTLKAQIFINQFKKILILNWQMTLQRIWEMSFKIKKHWWISFQIHFCVSYFYKTLKANIIQGWLGQGGIIY